MFFSILKDHFGNFVPSLTEDMWVEYNGMALKWHIPIGVSFDMFAQTDETAAGVPWEVFIHFQSYPENELLADPSLKNLLWHYTSTLKEADFIKNGSCRKVMGLSKSDQESLWEGLCKAEYDVFTSVNNTLTLNTTEFKHIPVRVYYKDGWRQKPVVPFREDGAACMTKSEREREGGKGRGTDLVLFFKMNSG
eukprot:TRINITY_DN2934_c2_g1_i3.p1 TRINITY_DN2934_c2_g1~~TRINITY_DN2934_c2_g1_i3.p1  ORF type:complete len:193 (-),score=36.78 TRINITY_DN2934_c2_g1_i3:357-935(-)